MAVAVPAPPEPSVGPRVRALREGMDLSLRELAARSGVSAPMLSQVERGETSPTLAVATRIASGPGAVAVPAAAAGRGGGRLGGARERAPRRRLAARAATATRCSPRRSRVSAPSSPSTGSQPGAVTGGPDDPPMHEPGARETAVVTAGELRLVCDGIAHDLREGDAVTFDADLPHHFENPSEDEARMLAVVSAGLRRS